MLDMLIRKNDSIDIYAARKRTLSVFRHYLLCRHEKFSHILGIKLLKIMRKV